MDPSDNPGLDSSTDQATPQTNSQDIAGEVQPKSSQSFKFDVTPESPIKISPNSKSKPIASGKKPFQKRNIAIIAMIIILAGLLAYMYIGPKHVSSVTTTIPQTTTVKTTTFSKISTCTQISSPGTYYLSSNVKYGKASGACISINASNVSLICNGNSLTGSGPFSAKQPYTYGIAINKADNVVVSGCNVANFSYGIAAYNSKRLSATLDNLSYNTMSEVLLSNTSSSNVSKSFLSRSLSAQGAIMLENGSTNDTVLNNTIAINTFYGVNISASGNRFVNNYIYSSPNSFTCTLGNGFLHNNSGYGNICTNETGCSFLSCKGVNIPPNLSAIVLPKVIYSCGAITYPGSYSLGKNIYMNNLINTSNPMSASYPCINIESPDVQLNCSGYEIYNATIAFETENNYNTSLHGCKAYNSAVGFYAFNSTNADVNGFGAYNTVTAISYALSKGGIASNIYANKGSYGVYLAKSTGVTITNFTLLNETYGAYVSGSVGNAFAGGLITNSTKLSVYASVDSTNASDNFMQTTSCDLTNAAWATCKQHIAPTETFIPISSCQKIIKPGNYTLQQNLVVTGPQCFEINAKNVAINCAYHSVTLSTSNPQEAAFEFNKENNISISNCTLTNFPYAIAASNLSGVRIYNINSSDAKTAIMLYNVSYVNVHNTIINGAGNTSIYMNGVSNSVVYDNNITGTDTNIGILIANSTHNIIASNKGIKNRIGIYLTGDSLNNNVSNNTMQISSTSDYACSAKDSAIDAEQGGINFGSTKQNCNWLAAVSPISPFPTCTAILSPETVELTSDYEYTTGALCFGAYANGTTINCNGHTIIATSNGTFALFKNAQNSNIDNCYLKGFKTPIKVYNSSISVINNTIYSYSSNSTAINVSNSEKLKIEDNKLLADGIGISLSKDQFGILQNNIVNASSISYLLNNSSAISFNNNTAQPESGLGLILANTTSSTFQNNILKGIAGGILCSHASESSYNNTDLGGNICSASQNCKWISASKATC
ncbi:MAG: NosD domain-containing protein [Candidatus Micrarchaeia archaeon]